MHVSSLSATQRWGERLQAVRGVAERLPRVYPIPNVWSEQPMNPYSAGYRRPFYNKSSAARDMPQEAEHASALRPRTPPRKHMARCRKHQEHDTIYGPRPASGFQEEKANRAAAAWGRGTQQDNRAAVPLGTGPRSGGKAERPDSTHPAAADGPGAACHGKCRLWTHLRSERQGHAASGQPRHP